MKLRTLASPAHTSSLRSTAVKALQCYTRPRLELAPYIFPLARASYATVSDPVKDPASDLTLPPAPSIPYSELTVGIVKEIFPNEKRVAITPQNVTALLKKGFAQVLVERGAGAEAQFLDEAYQQAGAKLVDGSTAWQNSDIILKVRAPTTEGLENEVDLLKDGSTIISFLYPAQNKQTVEKLASRGVNSFAMDLIPRISRAQVFDALR